MKKISKLVVTPGQRVELTMKLDMEFVPEIDVDPAHLGMFLSHHPHRVTTSSEGKTLIIKVKGYDPFYTPLDRWAVEK